MALKHDQISHFSVTFCICLNLLRGHGQTNPAGVRQRRGLRCSRHLHTFMGKSSMIFHYHVGLSRVLLSSVPWWSHIFGTTAHDIPESSSLQVQHGVFQAATCANRSCASCRVSAIKNHGADLAVFVGWYALHCNNLWKWIGDHHSFIFILQDLNLRKKTSHALISSAKSLWASSSTSYHPPWHWRSFQWGAHPVWESHPIERSSMFILFWWHWKTAWPNQLPENPHLTGYQRMQCINMYSIKLYKAYDHLLGWFLIKIDENIAGLICRFLMVPLCKPSVLVLVRINSPHPNRLIAIGKVRSCSSAPVGSSLYFPVPALRKTRDSLNLGSLHQWTGSSARSTAGNV